MKKLNLVHTAAALKVYDKAMARLNAKIDKAKNQAEFEAITASEGAALKVLQDAFHQDTQDRNSFDHCRAATASFIRELVTKYGPKETQP